MPFLEGVYYLTQGVQQIAPPVGDCHCYWYWYADEASWHTWSGGGYEESGLWQDGLVLVLDKNNNAFISNGTDVDYSFPCKMKHCAPVYPDYEETCTGTFWGCQANMSCEWCQVNYDDRQGGGYISSSLHRWSAQIVYCPEGVCPEPYE
jgi:hypothetical protein